MVDLYRQLSDDADDIADKYRRDTANAAAERDQIRKRLAELDEIERISGHLASRLSALKNIYLRRDGALCPDCALHGRDPVLMRATVSDDPDSFDSFVCPGCGHTSSVPLRDWGTRRSAGG